eukprot:m.224599 g.224599  ORF g.224599 m.224599 type:complete len:117 (-) comp13853_c0_seq11:92-442(-)
MFGWGSNGYGVGISTTRQFKRILEGNERNLIERTNDYTKRFIGNLSSTCKRDGIYSWKGNCPWRLCCVGENLVFNLNQLRFHLIFFQFLSKTRFTTTFLFTRKYKDAMCWWGKTIR